MAGAQRITRAAPGARHLNIRTKTKGFVRLLLESSGKADIADVRSLGRGRKGKEVKPVLGVVLFKAI